MPEESTYDLETVIGKIRLLISDVGGADGKSFLFKDGEIQSFFEMEGESVRMGAASALRTIAGNEAQVSKRITFLDLKTDGPGVAKSLIELAEKLEDRENDSVLMDFGQMGVDLFSRRSLSEQFATGSEQA